MLKAVVIITSLFLLVSIKYMLDSSAFKRAKRREVEFWLQQEQTELLESQQNSTSYPFEDSIQQSKEEITSENIVSDNHSLEVFHTIERVEKITYETNQQETESKVLEVVELDESSKKYLDKIKKVIVNEKNVVDVCRKGEKSLVTHDTNCVTFDPRQTNYESVNEQQLTLDLPDSNIVPSYQFSEGYHLVEAVILDKYDDNLAKVKIDQSEFYFIFNKSVVLGDATIQIQVKDQIVKPVRVYQEPSETEINSVIF
ncbi:hypothetical protein V1503_24110 [Bacillus sp. SCS-151]|uniref:hypothetical protein n=1 Tax=Nanhaiella sioensis TaxID=3115293 RepID=UPI00397DFD8A